VLSAGSELRHNVYLYKNTAGRVHWLRDADQIRVSIQDTEKRSGMNGTILVFVTLPYVRHEWYDFGVCYPAVGCLDPL
jgi:hypothetical protein